MARATQSGSGKRLTPDLVVAEALGLIDELGVAGLTMRTLADRLGTYPTSIYWHVGNRNDVLTRVFETVMGEMEVPAPTALPWDEWLALAAREYRRALHLHPNTAVLALYPLVTAADFVEAMLATLVRGGFREAQVAHAFKVRSRRQQSWRPPLSRRSSTSSPSCVMTTGTGVPCARSGRCVM
jgi:AcrR family transcriptional regulator